MTSDFVEMYHAHETFLLKGSAETRDTMGAHVLL